MDVQARSQRIKEIIVERLNLAAEPTAIDDDQRLFDSAEEGGLGLDSVDALELAVALNGEFDVEIGDEDMDIFQSVRKMTDFLDARLITA